jgi:hypothetical protein
VAEKVVELTWSPQKAFRREGRDVEVVEGPYRRIGNDRSFERASKDGKSKDFR